jgi:hypothetical protein
MRHVTSDRAPSDAALKKAIQILQADVGTKAVGKIMHDHLKTVNWAKKISIPTTTQKSEMMTALNEIMWTVN